MCSHHSSSKRTSERSLPAPRTPSKRSRAKVSTRRSSASTRPVYTATISSAEPRVPSFAMDRPVLHAFVDELVEDERLAPFAEALPTRARVSEPALPLLLASLHERLGRGLVCALPEDADARDAADAAAWFLGGERVALLPSRGVHWGSGLEPPPHLVGERARALDVLARGGLVCASAAALAEPLPLPAARPEPIRVASGTELSLEAL